MEDGKEPRTHLKNIPAVPYCCWQDNGVGQEAKLSLSAKYIRDSHWWTIADELKLFLRCSYEIF